MAAEIHGTVEDPDDLEGRSANAEEDQMAALRGDLAARKKVIATAPFFGICKDFFKSGPKRIEIGLLLVGSPFFQGVKADGAEI